MGWGVREPGSRMRCLSDYYFGWHQAVGDSCEEEEKKPPRSLIFALAVCKFLLVNGIMLCYLAPCNIYNDTSYRTIKHQKRKQKLENLFLLILLSCFVVARAISPEAEEKKNERSRRDRLVGWLADLL